MNNYKSVSLYAGNLTESLIRVMTRIKNYVKRFLKHREYALLMTNCSTYYLQNFEFLSVYFIREFDNLLSLPVSEYIFL